jgi:hypothetical protein
VKPRFDRRDDTKGKYQGSDNDVQTKPERQRKPEPQRSCYKGCGKKIPPRDSHCYDCIDEN